MPVPAEDLMSSVKYFLDIYFTKDGDFFYLQFPSQFTSSHVQHSFQYFSALPW